MKNNLINTDCLKTIGKYCTLPDRADANISKSERVLSIATGAFILFHGVKNIFSCPLVGLGEVAAGGALMRRGFTGNCKLKALAEEESTTDPVIVHTTTEQINIS